MSTDKVLFVRQIWCIFIPLSLYLCSYSSMKKIIEMQNFIDSLKNRTNEKGKGVVLKDQGKPVAVVLAYEDYLELIKNVAPMD
jgi:hypothetical protein